MAFKKILYIVTEIEPFLSLCSSAQLARQLALSLAEQKNEVRVIMPRFHVISERKNSIHSIQRLSGINIKIGEISVSLVVKVATISHSKPKLQVYFIDHEELFSNRAIFEEKKGIFYPGTEDRLVFMCKSALTIIKHLMWAPDIIHTIGWPWALVPAYGKLSYSTNPLFKSTHFIHTYDELGFDIPFDSHLIHKATSHQVTENDLAALSPGTALAFNNLVAQYADQTSYSFDPTGHPLAAFLKASQAVYIPNDEGVVMNYATLYEQASGVTS